MRGKWDNLWIRDAGTATGSLIIFILELLSLIFVRVCGPLTFAVSVFFLQMPIFRDLVAGLSPILSRTRRHWQLKASQKTRGQSSLRRFFAQIFFLFFFGNFSINAERKGKESLQQTTTVLLPDGWDSIWKCRLYNILFIKPIFSSKGLSSNTYISLLEIEVVSCTDNN